MEKELRINCPGCGTVLIVDRISGKILETRKPLVDNSTGDRLKDAFLKAEQDREKRAAAFDNMKEIQEKKRKLAEDIFNASMEDSKNRGDERPDSIFDAD